MRPRLHSVSSHDGRQWIKGAAGGWCWCDESDGRRLPARVASLRLVRAFSFSNLRLMRLFESCAEWLATVAAASLWWSENLPQVLRMASQL